MLKDDDKMLPGGGCMDKSIKIILITSANFPRGSAAANFLNLFCKGVAFSGGQIEVFLLKGYFLAEKKTNDSRSNLTDYGVKYTYLGRINRSSYKIIKILSDIKAFFSLFYLLLSDCRNRKRTTIFTYNNEIQNSFLINIYCRITGTKLITFVSEFYDISEFAGGLLTKMRWYGFLLTFNYLNRLADKLIVFSSYIRDRYLEKGFPKEMIMVQPNLTDFDFWQNESEKVEFTLGYCGTPYKKDGLEDLLNAVSIQNNKGCKINLLIIGDVVNEKSIIPVLQEYCEKLGILECVTFTGLISVEEVKDWLGKCKVLVITRPLTVQTMAGFPTKIGEYFACRKIVLSTKIGDIGIYFNDKEEIVFAEPGNPDSISKEIDWILENPVMCSKIALNGYEKAKTLLDYKVKVPEILSFTGCNK